MWSQAIQTIKIVVQEQITLSTQADLLVSIKDFLLLFTITLQSFSYEVQPLLYFSGLILESYIESLLSEYNTKFLAVFSINFQRKNFIKILFLKKLSDEKWQPLVISDQTQLKMFLLDNGLNEGESIQYYYFLQKVTIQ